jgi:hypothetical protein
MTSTTESTLTVSGASAARDAAQQHREELRQRIATGDTSITAADLASADADIEFADLRIEAAQLAEQRDAEAQRLADVEALRAEIERFQGEGVGALRKLYAAAVKAIGSLEEAAEAHVAERTRLAARARTFGLNTDAAVLADFPFKTAGETTDWADTAVRESRGQVKQVHPLQSDAQKQTVRDRAATVVRREPGARQFNTRTEAHAAGVEWTG